MEDFNSLHPSFSLVDSIKKQRLEHSTLSTFLVKVFGKYLEATFLNETMTQHDITYYHVMTPLGSTWINVDQLYIPVKGTTK